VARTVGKKNVTVADTIKFKLFYLEITKNNQKPYAFSVHFFD